MITSATWDERLITRQRAADLCGTWSLSMDYPYLRCGDCTGNITKLPSEGKTLDIDNLIAAVVRHMCMNHDYKLSGAGNEGERADGSADYAAGHRRSNDLVADPVC